MEQFPLGLFANATFRSGSVEVEPGDILVLLTDGLPEVTDGNDEQFGHGANRENCCPERPRFAR